jgi:hypothetical protein
MQREKHGVLSVAAIRKLFQHFALRRLAANSNEPPAHPAPATPR